MKRTKENKAGQKRICYGTYQLYQSLTNPTNPQAGHEIKQKYYPDEILTKPKNQHRYWPHENNV